MLLNYIQEHRDNKLTIQISLYSINCLPGFTSEQLENEEMLK